MTQDTGPPSKGVRISIYLPEALATKVDDAAYAARKSRSRFLADVIEQATKPKTSSVRKDPPVPSM